MSQNLLAETLEKYHFTLPYPCGTLSSAWLVGQEIEFMKVVSSVTNYISEVRGEMAKVTWPTRSQTIRMSVLVIVVSIVMGIFIGGLDYVFSAVLSAVLQR